jgi:hypothetical protein
VKNASYVHQVNGIVLAHRGRQSLPDHAALVVELEREEAVGEADGADDALL